MTPKSSAWYTPWIVCLSAALFFFYEFIQSNMFSSLATDVMAALHINESAYSLLASIYFLANVIFLFPAGTILDRFSTKRIILLSLSVCIIGTFLFAYSHSFWEAAFCRFLTGIGSAFCFLSCIRLASRWFPAHRLAFATGFIVTFAMTGGVIAQTPLTLLIQHFDWRTAIQLDALLGLLIFILIQIFVKDNPKGMAPPERTSHLPVLSCMKEAYFRLHNILCALYTSLMNMPIVLLGAMAGTIYLMQGYNMPRTEASYATSLLFIGTLIGAPCIGWLSDKLGMRKPLMIGSVLIALGLVTILFSGMNLSQMQIYMLFLGLGLITSTQVLSYPLVAENNPHAITATAVSVVSILTQGGSIFYQNIFGFWLESQWSGKLINDVPIYTLSNYIHAFWLIPIGFVIALIAAILIKEKPNSNESACSHDCSKS